MIRLNCYSRRHYCFHASWRVDGHGNSCGWISATDSHIDRLVYDFYGLTEEEIKLVEGE